MTVVGGGGNMYWVATTPAGIAVGGAAPYCGGARWYIPGPPAGLAPYELMLLLPL